MKTAIFTEKTYKSSMEGAVKNWWNSSVHPIHYKSFDGTGIQGYYAVNPEASASIVMVHGFTEHTLKFAEVMYYFFQEGYSVFMYDQRGHGKSGRKVNNPYLVYVKTFDEYVEDLRIFIEKVVNRFTPGATLYLFGHSMGGCISALFLERYPQVFSKAILTSPMLKMNFGAYPPVVAKGMAAFSKYAKWDTRPAPGALPFSAEPDFENTCATSKARYLYHLNEAAEDERFQTFGATYGWVRAAIAATQEVLKNARLATMPILICQSGNDTLVDNAGQDSFAAHAPNATLVRFPTAKHEIYRSPEDVLKEYYDTLFSFL